MKIPKYLIALALVGIIDAVSYMVVAPSIVFYVLRQGGTHSQYGIILSAFSFASFSAKPFVGYFSDKCGFRLPYMVCLLTSAFGGFLYFIASAFYGTTAVTLMLLGRLLGGVGAASSALGFAYLTKAIPHDEQTKTTSLLSMTRIIGMSTGPGFNVFLAKLDTEWFGFHIDSLNSVGLVLIATNLLALFAILFMLEEPPANNVTAPSEDQYIGTFWSRTFTLLRSLCNIGILVPIFSIFTMNSNFQIIETALAPAASHGMGWTTVGISGILGSLSIVMLINMAVVFSLSARKIRDEYIVILGAALNATGFLLVWYLWQWEAQPWQYILPVVISASAFPYLSAPTRSIYTKAVDGIPMLDQYQGAMQALLSMFASAAGFIVPGLVATFMIRRPEEVERSADRRELSPISLIAPTMSVLVLIGYLAVLFSNTPGKMDIKDVAEAGESSRLLDRKNQQEQHERRRSSCIRKHRFSTKAEVHRRSSIEIMGMVPPCMHDELLMDPDFQDDSDDGDDENRASVSAPWGRYQGIYKYSGWS